jgi:hypothetical protein
MVRRLDRKICELCCYSGVLSAIDFRRFTTREQYDDHLFWIRWTYNALVDAERLRASLDARTRFNFPPESSRRSRTLANQPERLNRARRSALGIDPPFYARPSRPSISAFGLPPRFFGICETSCNFAEKLS